jgi:two-component system, response regulator YesN
MFKLLLVDDEPIIVEGLYEMFKDYKDGSLDVYKAYSAHEALEWLDKKRMDIVITDMKMPGMDGLQLLEKIKLNWPECKVIFLTGHDEFDYIYKAIQYEGVSYLLKTEGYESIAAMVERYLEEIINSYRNNELIKKAENKMKKALPLLQKEFLSDLAEGMDLKDISQQLLDELEIPLNVELPVILLAGSIIYSEDDTGIRNKSNLYAVNYTVEQYLSPYSFLVGLIKRENYIMWFMQPKIESQGLILNSSREAALYLRNVLESVQSICRESINLKVSFVIGCDSVSWSEISLYSDVLKSILNSCMRQGMEVIVTDSQFREYASGSGKDQQHVSLQLKKLEIMATYMEQGRKEDFFHVFSELRDFFTHFTPDGSLDYEAYYSISLLFITYINRHNMEKSVSNRFNSGSLLDSKSYNTMEEAFDFFGQIADIIFNAQIVETEKRSIASIQKIQDYIQNNLGDDLSLNSLADLVFFNPKYLSRLFKQVTGSNLLDYINEKKLAKAKELLQQSHVKVHEISKAVGYTSGPYFTKFFKKGASMTPQEYRDSFLNSREKTIK